MLFEIEDKIWVLKHAGEWVENNTTQPAAIALAAGTKLPPLQEEMLSKQNKAQLTQIVEHHKFNNHNINNHKDTFVHQE